MMDNTELSNNSKRFLEDMRVYLFSNGKNWEEVDQILDELETHLREAERDGKPIEKIIGNSPKEYMKMVSSEMKLDYRMWMKYIVLIVFATFAFSISQDMLQGKLAYSMLEIIGNVVITILFIALVVVAFKYVSARSLSLKKQVMLFFVMGLLPLGLFFGLIYLNRVVDTPVLHFGTIGTWVIGVITVLFLIGMSIWAKTWVLIVFVSLTSLPDYFLGFTSLSTSSQLITSQLILVVGVILYVGFIFKREKSNEGV